MTPIDQLEVACAFYCRWYDKGDPRISGTDVAYELVTMIRQALHDLKEEEWNAPDTLGEDQ